jgi:L-ascorbate metabolism protein UlaG (beta-lactamase superfamily)
MRNLTQWLLFGVFNLTGLAGGVEVIPIHHGSLILKWQEKVVYVDPWSRGDYTGQPPADLILITDIHGDHMDPEQISRVRKEGTIIVAPAAVQKTVSEARVLSNGETIRPLGIQVEGVAMYNLKRGPEAGQLYHTRGRGNGYILTFGKERVYISGDTECIPEMKALQDIDLAFVCMNLPYTMTPEEAAECVNSFRPKAVYPYHFRGSEVKVFERMVTAEGVEVRVLDWY